MSRFRPLVPTKSPRFSIPTMSPIVLGLAAMLAGSGCGVIIEVPLDPSTEGSDTGESSSSTGERTTGLDEGSSGCNHDECPPSGETEEGSSGEGTGDSIPPPGPSYCALPHAEGDEGIATDSQDLPLDGALTDVHVLVRVTNHIVGDLQIWIEHEGVELMLLDHPLAGQCLGSHVDAIFDDDADVEANDSCSMDGSAIVGAVLPHDSLSSFVGLESGGTWTIRVEETPNANEPGMLNLESWCIALSTGERMP